MKKIKINELKKLILKDNGVLLEDVIYTSITPDIFTITGDTLQPVSEGLGKLSINSSGKNIIYFIKIVPDETDKLKVVFNTEEIVTPPTGGVKYGSATYGISKYGG